MLIILRPITLAVSLVAFAPAAASEQRPTAGERWERALLDAKRRGRLPGPKPGQRCLWSEKLGACLWYTPGRLDFKP